ncbi:MAG: tRNA (guanosine(37)-N1)-methyltransferase TrmD [Patescibacteria group bacterium]
MTFHILTIFPDIFSSYFSQSIIKRAQAKKIIAIKIYNLRDWAKGAHRQVDDRPYGGGAGMVLMAEPIIKALKHKNIKTKNLKIILLSAKGKRWTQALAKKYANPEHSGDNIILICGRYEGVDERVKKLVDEEISVGDYVLTGGEIPAMIIVDSITRLLPGVLGNAESAQFESHSQAGVLEHPHYTRPEKLAINGRTYKVPAVLLSGDHKKIEEWRQKKSKKLK